jgi:hypothetical protein
LIAVRRGSSATILMPSSSTQSPTAARSWLGKRGRCHSGGDSVLIAASGMSETM